MTTSIIICAYTLDRWNDICEAVESARRQEPPATEIILVCDHNRELKEKCELQFPDVVVIENSEARGLSGARNSGIDAARGSLIVFLDDDAVADKHFVRHLVRQCEKPNVIAAVARVKPQWLAMRPTWLPDEFLWTLGCTHRGAPETAAQVRNIMGGAMCMRREVFEKVGGFTHSLGRSQGGVPISCEDTELSIRAQRGIPASKMMYEPEAVIRHKIPGKRLTLGYFGLRCYAEGISKAQLSRILGSTSYLSVERSYVFRTLSWAVLRELGQVITLRDWHGISRVGAIVYGTVSAAVGFGVGTFTRVREPAEVATAPGGAPPLHRSIHPQGKMTGIQ